MSARITFRPEPGTEPTCSISPYVDTIGIPYISLTPEYAVGPVEIKFDPRDPDDAIRYLRKLAAVATDLADQIEQKVAEAVLSS